MYQPICQWVSQVQSAKKTNDTVGLWNSQPPSKDTQTTPHLHSPLILCRWLRCLLVTDEDPQERRFKKTSCVKTSWNRGGWEMFEGKQYMKKADLPCDLKSNSLLDIFSRQHCKAFNSTLDTFPTSVWSVNPPCTFGLGCNLSIFNNLLSKV